MRAIRVMCGGRVDPTFVLKALREGADGVLIAGCHPGECHYVEGNIKALRRYILLKRMLKQWGIEAERVHSSGPPLRKEISLLQPLTG